MSSYTDKLFKLTGNTVSDVPVVNLRSPDTVAAGSDDSVVLSSWDQPGVAYSSTYRLPPGGGPQTTLAGPGEMIS